MEGPSIYWLGSIALLGSIDQTKTAVNRVCCAKTIAFDPHEPTESPAGAR
jgi:hypothetical protein